MALVCSGRLKYVPNAPACLAMGSYSNLGKAQLAAVFRLRSVSSQSPAAILAERGSYAN